MFMSASIFLFTRRQYHIVLISQSLYKVLHDDVTITMPPSHAIVFLLKLLSFSYGTTLTTRQNNFGFLIILKVNPKMLLAF